MNQFTKSMILRYLNRQTRPSWIRRAVAWYWIGFAPIGTMISHAALNRSFIPGIRQIVHCYWIAILILVIWGVLILLNRDGWLMCALCATAAGICMALNIWFSVGRDLFPVLWLLFAIFVLLTIVAILELTRKPG